MGTSLGLAVSSSVATATSQKYQRAHPELGLDSPEVLMAGFRAAGWTCFAAAVVCFGFALFGLRGIGIVGSSSGAPTLSVKSDTKQPKSYHPLSIHTLGLLMAFSVFGVLARLGLSALATYNRQSIFPLSYSQAAGCFIMGFCLALKEPFSRWYPPAYTALTTGFCGSLTTFSGWQLDIFKSWLNADEASWSALDRVGCAPSSYRPFSNGLKGVRWPV
jgi:fluoride ion exporter CrcB/FEX